MTGSNDNEHFDEVEEPPDSQLTELVAYLDGELDDPTTESVERKLVQDPGLRQYAETLDRTWQLLDSLGDAQASGAFTQKTLASLATVSAESSASQRRTVSQKFFSLPWIRIVAWSIAGFVATTGGLLLSRTDSPQRSDATDEQILRQLELLRNYEKYYSVPSADFLRDVEALKTGDAQKTRAPKLGQVQTSGDLQKAKTP